MTTMTQAPRRRRHDQDGDDAHDHLPVAEVLRGEIERRAYQLFVARGRQDGRDVDDWLTAEREFLMPLGTLRPESRV
jgi:hypothetical protein